MVHIFSQLAFASLVFYSTAIAQSIDPSSVPQATRNQWCTSQITSCPLLCLQFPGNSEATTSNTCDSTSLSFSCVCQNGQQPNASEYSQTIPYFICTENDNTCVNNCAQGDSACQASCRTDHPCGAQDPKRYNSTSTTSAGASKTSDGAASTGSDGAAYSGFGGSASTTAASSDDGDGGKTGGATLLDVGRAYGVGITASLIFGAFAVLL